jgi:pyruvate-formate lyase-activating enzyme
MKRDTKNSWLHIRVSSDERRIIENLSSLSGYKISEWIRIVLIREFKKTKKYLLVKEYFKKQKKFS